MGAADDSTSEARALLAALDRLPPREAAVLRARLVHGHGRHKYAAHLGVSVESHDVALLRAARALAVPSIPPGPGSWQDERQQAAALAAWLEAGTPPPPPLKPLCASLERLVRLREALRQQLAARAAAEAAERPWPTWVRVLLVAALVAAAVWLGR